MSDSISPIRTPARAAHEVVLELIRANRLATAQQAADAFTTLYDHYVKESQRIPVRKG